MDRIFDDDFSEVGAEIEAYCTKCRADGGHTVITKYEDEVRSVQCTACGSVHAYRPPRGEAEEDIPEPLAVKRRQAARKPTWDEAMATLDAHATVPYDVRQTYVEGALIDHPKFGRGYVIEILAETKMEALFKDDRRMLIHGRKDLPAPKGAPKAPPPPATAAPTAKAPKADGKGKAKAAAKAAAKPAAKGAKAPPEAPAPKAPAAKPSAKAPKAPPSAKAAPGPKAKAKASPPSRQAKPRAAARRAGTQKTVRRAHAAKKAARPAKKRPAKPRGKASRRK